jgi:hypothetical protein
MGDQPVGAHGFFGEPAEELGGIGGLALGVRARLAVFQRDEMGEIVQPRGHQLPRLAQDLGAFARLRAAQSAMAAFGGIERRIGIRDLGGGDEASTSSVAGLMTSKRSAPLRHSPSI